MKGIGNSSIAITAGRQSLNEDRDWQTTVAVKIPSANKEDASEWNAGHGSVRFGSSQLKAKKAPPTKKNNRDILKIKSPLKKGLF
jgi:hypothetical protein